MIFGGLGGRGVFVGWVVVVGSTSTILLKVGVGDAIATCMACTGANPSGVGVLYSPQSAGFGPQETSRMDSKEKSRVVFFIFIKANFRFPEIKSTNSFSFI